MRELMRRFVRDRAAMFGLGTIVVLVLAAIFGPLLWTTSPLAIDHAIIGYPLPPSLQHPFGTDILGRDAFARALVGARISLTVGLTAMIIGISVGTMYGAIAGLVGGWIDGLMMRFVDAMLSFPAFFLIVTVEALTETFSLVVIVLIIGLLSWMGVARLVRAEVLSLRERDFIEAARALGASQTRIITRHLIPNAFAPVVVAATFAVGDNILVESGLSFLGLGVQIPTPSWGNMLQDALLPILRGSWWLVVVPGMLIVITVLSFSVIGEGLRVAFDRSSTQDVSDADAPEERAA